MLCGGSIINLFGCLRVRMFKKASRRVKVPGLREFMVLGCGFFQLYWVVGGVCFSCVGYRKSFSNCKVHLS